MPYEWKDKNNSPSVIFINHVVVIKILPKDEFTSNESTFDEDLDEDLKDDLLGTMGTNINVNNEGIYGV